MPWQESQIIEAIKAQFSIRANEKFLKGEWRKRHRESKLPSTGYCYLATHAYFALMGGAASGLLIKKWNDTDNYSDGHFWAERESGEIVDLTSDQYPRGFQHYAQGTISTRRPSSYAVEFINVVRTSLTETA